MVIHRSLESEDDVYGDGFAKLMSIGQYMINKVLKIILAFRIIIAY